MLMTILAAFVFYLFPLAIGTFVQTVFAFLFAPEYIPESLLKHLQKNIEKIKTRVTVFLQGVLGKKASQEPYPLVLQAVFPFAIGALTILGLAELSQFLHEYFVEKSFTTFFFPAAYSLTTCGVGVWIYRLYKNRHQFFFDPPVFLLVLAMSVLSFAIWQYRAPYPLNWDLYEHQTLSTLIHSGSYNFSTNAMSDTFGFASYPPTFHLLLALSQTLISLSPEGILQYWNVLSFLHLLTVSTAAYYFAYSISKNRSVAALSCVVGTLSFESVVAFTSFFILPQTVTATLWALFLARLIWSYNRSTPLAVSEVLLSSLTLILFHYVIGTLAALFYLASYIFLRLQAIFLKPKVLHATWLLVLLASLGGIASSYIFDLSQVNKGEAALYIFSLSELGRYFSQMYGLSFLVAGVGFWYFWFKKSEKTTSHLLLLMLVPLLAIIVSHFPYVLKFLTLARFPLLLLVASGIAYGARYSKFRLVVLPVTIIWFSSILLSNTNQWQQHLLLDNTVAHVHGDDLVAAQFLKDHYPAQETLLISDPSTSYLLEGLSGINSAGGAFAKTETRQIFQTAGTKAFKGTALEELKRTYDPVSPNPKRYILALSGRTFRWLIATPEQQFSFDYNLWRPELLSGYNRLVISTLLEEKPEAKLVFQNDSLVLIEF